MSDVIATNQTILVVGGGISGIPLRWRPPSAASRSCWSEKRPYLGGRVCQLYKYFPKLCFPTCGLKIQYRRQGQAEPDLAVLTMAEVVRA